MPESYIQAVRARMHELNTDLTEDDLDAIIAHGIETVPQGFLHPNWEGMKYLKWNCDFRNHIDEDVQALWETFTPLQKAALAAQAHKVALAEYDK